MTSLLIVQLIRKESSSGCGITLALIAPLVLVLYSDISTSVLVHVVAQRG